MYDQLSNGWTVYVQLSDDWTLFVHLSNDWTVDVQLYWGLYIQLSSGWTAVYVKLSDCWIVYVQLFYGYGMSQNITDFSSKKTLLNMHLWGTVLLIYWFVYFVSPAETFIYPSCKEYI